MVVIWAVIFRSHVMTACRRGEIMGRVPYGERPKMDALSSLEMDSENTRATYEWPSCKHITNTMMYGHNLDLASVV